VIDLDVEAKEIGAGDPAAFGRWLAGAEAPLRDSLRAFAARVDVESLVQEALLRVWNHAAQIAPDGRPNALLRWGIRAARNLAISELRRARADPTAIEALEALAGAAPAPVPPDPLLRECIRRCRAALPRKPAAALAARLDAAGGEPDRVLAARLGMQLNTFLKNVGRARTALRDCLRRLGVEVA
jgi:RNA polymerase sigma-70 factor (ECF subfamily)